MDHNVPDKAPGTIILDRCMDGSDAYPAFSDFCRQDAIDNRNAHPASVAIAAPIPKLMT